MKHLTITTFVVSALLSSAAVANEFEDELRSLANQDISAWATHAAVISAVKKQNQEHKGVTQSKIDSLDQTWRSQVGSGGDLIDRTLGNDLSKFLKQEKSKHQGLYTEIFVTDNLGLNVGQSDVTSDYWQGDEAKWQVPYEEQKLEIGAIELDESTQTYQSQVSAPVMDPNSKSVIGVITVGINVEQLAQ